jgi:hypothetical protein
MLVSVNGMDAGGGVPTTSGFFRRPNGTTQLLAKVASVLDAVGGGAGCGCMGVRGSAPGRSRSGLTPKADRVPKGDARIT